VKINKIYKKLGAEGADVFGPIPEKPPRLHWSTYNRLREIAEEARLQLAEAIIKRFGTIADSQVASKKM